MKKGSDLAIKSLEGVVSGTVTMGFSEEHLVGRKGMFKHKCDRGLGDLECHSLFFQGQRWSLSKVTEIDSYFP